MSRPNARAVYKLIRDFGIGLLLFLGLALSLSTGHTTAFARPGADVAQPHTVIALRSVPPQLVVGGDAQRLDYASAASAFEPVVTGSGEVRATHPISVTLLALMIATITALNLALLRHVRLAYVKST